MGPKLLATLALHCSRTLGYGYYMVDINLGEMFLNFPLHEGLQRFLRVDFSQFNANLKESLPGPLYAKWVHWTRCWMGFKPSPFMMIRFYYLAEEFAREIGDTIGMH